MLADMRIRRRPGQEAAWWAALRPGQSETQSSARIAGRGGRDLDQRGGGGGREMAGEIALIPGKPAGRIPHQAARDQALGFGRKRGQG